MRCALTHRNLLIATLILPGLVAGCGTDREPEIAFGIDGCSECGMLIDKEKEAAAYLVDRELSPFCSTGCLLKSSENRRQQDRPLPDRVLISDYEGSGLHPAGEMTFLLTESHTTSPSPASFIATAGLCSVAPIVSATRTAEASGDPAA